VQKREQFPQGVKDLNELFCSPSLQTKAQLVKVRDLLVLVLLNV